MSLKEVDPEEVPETSDARRHFKEGQRFVTPINGDSTRGFYESLLQEKPHSHLAIRYCVENGLFSGDKHTTLLKHYYELKSSGIFNANRQAMQRIAIKTGEAIPAATTSPKRQVKRELSSPEPSEKKKKKHKKEKKDKKHKKEKKKEKKREYSSDDDSD
jgi:hypothetical protein